MIARYIWLISIVNDIGFLNLLREAEPRYSVPCQTTITRNLNDLYTSEKWRIRGVMTSVEFVSCTTDMWSSRGGDGYISLTCHFITSEFQNCCQRMLKSLSFYMTIFHHYPYLTISVIRKKTVTAHTEKTSLLQICNRPTTDLSVTDQLQICI